MKITEFLDVLKSDAPAPGGGSASALSGAQGCALLMMVADLTLGKEKYRDFEEICLQAKKKGQSLYEELRASIDRDTEAFNLISAAFKLPKDTDEEKAVRRAAIADGTLTATEVPFNTMKLGFEALKLVESLGKRIDRMLSLRTQKKAGPRNLTICPTRRHRQNCRRLRKICRWKKNASFCHRNHGPWNCRPRLLSPRAGPQPRR